MTVHVFFAFPETAGKTLEDVETMFTTPGLKPWKTTVQFHHVRKLEQGAIQSEKLADLNAEEGNVQVPKSVAKETSVSQIE
jgi:hypothetical protein